MHIDRHRVFHYRLPYARPVRWSDVVEDGAQFLMLHLTSSTGHEGIGETVLKPTWNGASARTVNAALEDLLLPMLQGQDVSDPQHVADLLQIIPGHQAAKTLLDNALWDLHAAAMQRPLWQLWNGQAAVALSWVLTRQSPALMVREAIDVIDRYGFGALKIKGGQGIDVDVQAVQAIRAAVGGDVELYVDANGAYAIDQAARYVNAMTRAGARLVEDPCRLAPDARFEALQVGLTSPVLVDFGNESVRDTALFLERGARGISLKPGRLGLSATRRMAAMAASADEPSTGSLAEGKAPRTRNCLTVVGMFGESAVGTLAALSQAAALPASSLPAETTWYLAMTDHLIDMPPILHGRLRLPSDPGLAQRIDWDRLAHLTKS